MTQADAESELEVDGSPRDGAVVAMLDALSARYGLNVRQQWQLARLLSLLETDDHAPTTVRTPAAAVDVHLADSLVALELDAVRSATTVADLGSGAGFPGLPLAVALAPARVSLIESSARKCAFLHRAAEAAAVSGASIVCGRVEDWPRSAGTQDVVTARALAAPPTVAEYAAPLLRVGGTLVDWRGRRDREQEDAGARAGALLGLEPVEIRRVTPFGSAQNRYLHLYLKVRATPERFPRRAGLARKRPLARSAGT